jgi:hypothetical protein
LHSEVFEEFKVNENIEAPSGVDFEPSGIYEVSQGQEGFENI